MSRPPVRNAQHLKLANRRRILRIIRRGPISRSDLARETGLTRAAMSLIIAGLIEAGMVTEGGQGQSSGGRKAVLIELRPEYACALGLTISRTGASAGVIDLNGRLLAEQQIAMHATSRTVSIRRMHLALRKTLANDLPRYSRVLGLGISAPGPIDSANGIILNPPNFDQWHNAQMKDSFADIAGQNVFLENNSTALTMAELAYGRGREISSFLVLVVESGIGAGIVQRGELYRGWGGFGSEVGHTSIDRHGPRCSCGLHGCVELYASVPNILRRARIKRWEHFVDAVHEGDTRCRRLLEEQARALSIALVNVLNVLELDAVVLTGDILYRGELLRAMVERNISRSAITRRMHHIPVYLSRLTEHTELMAAAAVATEAFFEGEVTNGSL